MTLAEANEAVARRVPEDDMVIALVGTHAGIGEAVAAAIPRLGGVTIAPFDLE